MLLRVTLVGEHFARDVSKGYQQRAERHADIMIDASKCVPWIGLQLLQSTSLQVRDIQVDTFLQRWKDHLPERWRSMVDLSLLKVCITFVMILENFLDKLTIDDHLVKTPVAC